MYNRYIRGDGGTYTRISAEDAPLPPPAPERGLLNGLLEKLHLSDLDAGDILLLILLFFLFRQEADEELLIAIGLLLIL